MILPVRPPMLPIALLALCAARLTAGPADEVTLERPCEAFEVAFEAVSLDFAAVSLAASLVEACRLVVWRAMKRVCRNIMRDGAAVDIDGRLTGIKRRAVPIRNEWASGPSVFLKLGDEWQDNFRANVSQTVAKMIGPNLSY